jgi:hypothetical protein
MSDTQISAGHAALLNSSTRFGYNSLIGRQQKSLWKDWLVAKILPDMEVQFPEIGVINYHTCNSCWNDVRVRFDHKDFLWCPRHANSPRQFECTRLITAQAVKDTIRRIPAFGERRTGATVSPIGRAKES